MNYPTTGCQSSFSQILKKSVFLFAFLAISFGLSAQTYDFTPTGDVIDGDVNAGATLSGQQCNGGLSAITVDVAMAAFTCPDGTELNTLIGDGLNIENVTIDLAHFFDGDVDIILTAPDGSDILLSDSNGGSGDNYTGTVFEDGNPDTNSGTAPFTGSFEAEEGPFAVVLAGVDAEGTWTLEACDSFNDGGVDGNGWNSASITLAPNILACPIVCTLTCSPDQLINLEAGECEEAVVFDAAVLGGDPLCMVAETFDIMGFQDGFGPADATTMASGDGAFVDVSGAPASIITSGGTTTGASCYNMVAPVDGAFSIDWNYETPDGSFWDPVEVRIDGVANEVTANTFGAGTESGTFIQNVTAGTTIGLCQTHDASVGPSVTTWSNLSLLVAPGYVIEQCGGPESGSFQGPGTYVIEYCATNNQDLTDVLMCSTTIIINDYIGPVTDDLTCNNDLNISVDEACEIEFGADMFLEGGPYSCYDDYIITIRPFGNENLDFIPSGPIDFSTAIGTHEYVITAPDGNSCWGEFTVEDKLGPAIECIDLAVSCIEPIPFGPNPGLDLSTPFPIVAGVQPAQDAVTEYVVNFGPDFEITDLDVVVDFEYELANTADATITITSPAGTSTDLWNAISGCGGFVNYINDDDGDAALACANLQDGGTANYSGVAGALAIVVNPLSVFNGESTAGAWTVTVTEAASAGGFPDGGQLTINEISFLFNGGIALPPSFPEDNCGSVSVSSSDVTTPGSCDTGVDRIIERTWLVTDQNGMSETCTQTITVTTIGVEDITPPVTPIELPCGTGTSPDEIVAFFDDPTTADVWPNNSCSLVVFEKNEGIPFGYFNYPETGCDGNIYPQPVDNNVCNIYASYSDQEIPACDPSCNGNVKVIRTWTVLDWCTPDAAPFVFTQIIKSEDTDAPTMELADDFQVSVNPWNCQGDFALPDPTLLHDLCTSDITYAISGPAGVTLLAPNTPANPSDNYIVFGASLGANEFTYTATDCCGNTTSEVLTVNVFDTTPPVPVGVENVIINLTTSGQTDENGEAIGVAKIFWNSIDDGSYDGCSGVKVEIAREEDACDVDGNDTFNADGHPDDGSPNPNGSNYDPDGGEFVKFCCADIDQVDPVTGIEFGLVPVRMRVFDDGNGTGFYGDFVDNNGDGDVLDAGEYDNYNETWVNVRVEGKSIPSLVCPPDVTLNCDMDYTDESMIGTATTFNLCGDETVSVSFTPQLNACGEGFVIATYGIDGSTPTISCSQRITIENQYDPFDPDGIRFPRNLPTSPTGQLTCDDDINYDAPTWTAGPCDFIGYTEEVDTFFFETDPNTGAGQDACFKILRTFTVIDWCVYDETNGQDGLYTGSQTIKITDREAPVLLSCENAMFGVDDNEDANGNGNICEKIGVTLTNSAIDNGDCSSDWLKWQVFVDTWGDGIVDYEYSSFLPTNDSNINNDTNGNGINDRYIAPTSSEEEIEIFVPETIESSMFNHVVNWKVTDGCGNVASCTTTFMVVDKKAPTPYCLSLHTALMADPDGDGPLMPMVELWAKDFDKGAFDNCTEQEDLIFTFGDSFPVLTLLDEPHYFKGEGQLATEAEYLAGEAQFWDPETQSSGMVFDCNDRPAVTIVVRVADEKGNSDTCVIFLGIIDNQDGCEEAGSRADIAGSISTATGDFVEGTEVSLDALLPEYPKSTELVDGEFAFADNDLFVDYDVTALLDDNHTNGVSTLDLVLIQRHIVGFGDLDSPYKVIAADINSDEKVSSIDVVELRKLILGVQDEFEFNTSWRFVNAAQEFADQVSPWPVNYSVAVDHLDANISNANMVAVKIGDVNDTYTSLTNHSTDVRSASTVVLSVEDEELIANQESRITITNDELISTQGLQMTIELNGVTPLAIESSLPGFGDANYVVSNNLVTVSWNSNALVTIDAEQTLFTIVADVSSDTNVSDVISISDRKVRSEMYLNEALEINGLELVVRDGNGIAVEIASKALLQNEPNPFTNETVITYYLDQTEKSATIKVIDVMGKVIYSQSVNADMGWNTHTISESDLTASGVYYYQLDAGNFSERKSMVLVK